MLTHLAPALKEIFASDTSDFAKMFANYMTQNSGKPAAARVVGPVAGPALPITMPPAAPVGK